MNYTGSGKDVAGSTDMLGLKKCAQKECSSAFSTVPRRSFLTSFKCFYQKLTSSLKTSPSSPPIGNLTQTKTTLKQCQPTFIKLKRN
jgi:hypothetical protein